MRAVRYPLAQQLQSAGGERASLCSQWQLFKAAQELLEFKLTSHIHPRLAMDQYGNERNAGLDEPARLFNNSAERAKVQEEERRRRSHFSYYAP